MSPYKGKVAHRSWQHLPPEIIRLIVTHALLEISTNAFIPDTWDHRDQWLPRMAFNVIRDTEALERFMFVCPSWSVALETHLFWAQAAAVLDPHDALLGFARNPLRLSPYHHFRFNVLNRSCVPCRINSPQTSHGLCNAKRQVFTFILGPVPCCRDHRKERFCGVCLRDATDESVVENEDGESWPNIEATCRSCRGEWLWRACDSGRERDAIGGKAFASSDWETRQAVDAFVEMGEGTVREVRALALEKHWLRKNTKIADMLSHAVAASRFQTREEGYESEDELSEDDDEEDPELMSMTEDAGGVRDLAINDWARNRILDGHWYSPADQWHLLQSQGANSADGVVPAVHPCPWNLSPEDAEERPHPSPTMARSEVPSSFALCEAAFEAFRKQMRAVLLPAMNNLVRKIVIECAADCVDPCIKAARLDVEDVARELRDAGMWYNGMDWLLRRVNGEREREEKERVVREREARERRERKEYRDDSSSSSKSDGSHTTSPVLSTSTLETTPSPPPLALKKHDIEAVSSPSSLTFPIAISPVLDSPSLIPSIPYIPITMAQLPPFTIETFKAVWREACAPLFQCRCNICERAVMKANVEAGNIVPTHVNLVLPLPTPHVQVQLRAATPDEEELVITPSVTASSDADTESTKDAGRKRSLEALEYEEEEEEENAEMHTVRYVTETKQPSTPPKRLRMGEYGGFSPEYVVTSSGRKLQKRPSEELDDDDEQFSAKINKKRARTLREESVSPPDSNSPSDEGGDHPQHCTDAGTIRTMAATPKSVFPVAPTAALLERGSPACVDDDDALYVLDEMS